MKNEINSPLWLRILVMFGYLLLMLLANNLGLISGLVQKLNMVWLELIVSLVGLFLAAGIIYWLYKKYQSYASTDTHTLTGKDWLWNIGYFILIRIVVIVFSIFIVRIYGEEFTDNDQVIINVLDQGSTIFVISMLITITFIAPLIEELVFRGMMTHYLFNGRQDWLVVLVSSLAFSMLHLSGNWLSFALYFAMGIVLHLAYFRRGSIKDAMIVHALNNILASISLLYMIYSNVI